MKPVSIAVVGLGKFGRLHARTLAQLAEVKLVGLVDPQPIALDADPTFSATPLSRRNSAPKTT